MRLQIATCPEFVIPGARARNCPVSGHADASFREGLYRDLTVTAEITGAHPSMRRVLFASVIMSYQTPAPRAVQQPARDAQTLLARLYREIGLAAVAAALQTPDSRDAPRRPSVRDIPAELRETSRAA